MMPASSLKTKRGSFYLQPHFGSGYRYVHIKCNATDKESAIKFLKDVAQSIKDGDWVMPV